MANNEGLLELNGKDIVQVIGEEAVPRAGDIDATTYNQKNYVISGSTYTITKDTPDVLYLELTGDFTFTCTGAENANRTIKVQIHKASAVSATTTITWNGVTEWLTDGNSAPVFGQVAITEQNLVVAICLSNTVVLANTLYNSENPVSGGAVTIANVTGLQDALTSKINLSGSRGQLAGYEQCVSVDSLTLTDTSADSNYYNSTSAITVNDGSPGMSWTKTVKLAQVPASVNMTANWVWVGGSAPTLVVNGLLVFTWQNTHGLTNFLSPSP